MPSGTSDFEAVIGLEVHAELRTHAKIFCGCSTEFGGLPNHHVCPVCAGMPGVLPVLNRKALELAITTGLALNCEISGVTKFDRKNYFYPDLPKAYQISQYDQPVCGAGYLDVPVSDGVKRIGITRAHLEEDAGKLLHQGAPGLAGSTHSLVDLNRAGVPLLEIVSEPDIRTPEEAKAYVQELRSILVYLGVNDGRLEQGSLRCDANVSIRRRGETRLGTKTEIKNMNSFAAIERAIRYEIARQIQAVEDGEPIRQETRLWNDDRQTTVVMRVKEGSADYRYFPDPDLPPIRIEAAYVADLRERLPELPATKRQRYQREFGLSAYDAEVLVAESAVAAYFEQAVSHYSANPKGLANWIMGEILAHLNYEKLSVSALKVQAAQLGELVRLIDEGVISGKIAKTVMARMLESGEAPSRVIDSMGLTMIADSSVLTETIKTVLANHPGQVNDYRQGKTKVVGYLVGQIMRATQGRAKPDLVNQLLLTELDQSADRA